MRNVALLLVLLACESESEDSVEWGPCKSDGIPFCDYPLQCDYDDVELSNVCAPQACDCGEAPPCETCNAPACTYDPVNSLPGSGTGVCLLPCFRTAECPEDMVCEAKPWDIYPGRCRWPK